MNWFHDLLHAARHPRGGVTLVISLAGLALTVRHVRATSLHETLDNGAISGLLAALIGIYAIAAGLTAVAVWGNTGDAHPRSAREASAITVLFHDFRGYPEPQRSQFRASIIDYTRYVIEQEWPEHERGEARTVPIAAVDAFEARSSASSPSPKGRRSSTRRRSTRTTACIEARRLRLQAVQDTALPLELWVVVVLLGVIAISACFLLRMQSFGMHAAITVIVAAPIALILYFIAVTDRPFQGGVSVSAEPYREVLQHIMLPESTRK